MATQNSWDHGYTKQLELRLDKTVGTMATQNSGTIATKTGGTMATQNRWDHGYTKQVGPWIHRQYAERHYAERQ